MVKGEGFALRDYAFMPDGKSLRSALRTLLSCMALISAMLVLSSTARAMTPLELLSMLEDARAKNSFQGSFIHRRGDSVSSYYIVHAVKDGVQYERLKSLDGAPREILRDGESVTCIHPEGVGSRWNQVPPLSPLMPAKEVQWDQLQQWLEFSILTHGRIAGRNAVIIEARPIENDRFIRRYGVDAETGLLLKTEILSLDGRSLELAQFSQVDINPNNIDQALEPTLSGVSTTFDRKHWSKPSAEMVQAWKPQWLPAGFELVSVAPGKQDKEFMEAFTYSDGLSSFSLFKEKPENQFVEMEGHSGGATVAVSRMVQAHDGQKWGVTLVGEIPIETAKKVAGSVNMAK